MKTRKCKCGATAMLIVPRWYNDFRKPTWVYVSKHCPHRKVLDPARGARPAGYYTTGMFSLMGPKPAAHFRKRLRRTHVFMRRNMTQAIADKVNALLTQLGWAERWEKE